MKHFLKLFTLLLLFVFVCQPSWAGQPYKETKTTKENQKVQKFLQSKMGQKVLLWALKRAEKKQERLAEKQQKRIAQGKPIKETKTQAKGLDITLMIVGLILILLGILLPDGGILAVLGAIALIVGLILYLM